ncbi:hypothetical protein COV24_00155 [candidate division WWE3 bacterium CG10_big_fil_rev_8_21_14_0_10_32_10]|uniref:Major facilitator superfamily (MFS) profile domain-containing protein n=1 Tax=candidate division WWE3 bacterium CG10_big_fil_rev_8_21_14_0_10_32_10 TaxID=1975090 RepID=A0A2H0RDM7_UNCKA|nr:MAG: hypothetical protein COV24_00155 [candidate division WWE3 bacterium CG10_big_fil_rev_8_21_14_0_10_32_10]
MPTFFHLVNHYKKYKSTHKYLYIFSITVFFWTLFDGIISFLTPIIITQKGFSTLEMGFILGTSSIWGATFDFFLSKIIKNPSFRKMYLILFAICFMYPFILIKANHITMFLVAMAIWGLYYDIFRFGLFDFVGTNIKVEEHSESFGIIEVFKSLGYLMAPLIAGLVIVKTINYIPLVLMWVFLTCSFLFFLLTIKLRKRNLVANQRGNYNLTKELGRWKKVGKTILPVLFLTLTLYTIDAFFWTIGPLVSENLKQLHPFGGMFLAVYVLPPLLVGWFIGDITKRFGKKRTSYIALFFGSIILITLGFIQNPIVIIFTVFIASLILSISWPSINGAYADYISETPNAEKEIQGLQDFFVNLGYVIGPISAGFLAEKLHYLQVFSIIGFFGILISVILLVSTPKSIRIKI